VILINDCYFTIERPSEYTHKEKGSKFWAFAYPVNDSEQLKQLLSACKKDSRFKGACHFCYAYKLGVVNPYCRSSDDGEPAGTAGKPMLNQIESLELTNVVIIVVRFFGGTLLGTSGLIKAYKHAAQGCLANAKLGKFILRKNICLTFSYPIQTDVDHILKQFDVEYDEKLFEEEITYKIKIRAGEFDQYSNIVCKASAFQNIKMNEY
jgi:uncharacterized YigZ family protein